MHKTCKQVILVMVFAVLNSLQSLTAQQYVSPKQYKVGLSQNVLVATNSDVTYLKKHINKFFALDVLRIDGDVDISEFAQIVEILGDIEQIELVNFKGQLLDEDVAKFDWVGEVLVTIPANQENHILNTPYLQKLSSLILVFEEVPTDWDFLKTYTCRSLKLIAPFTDKEVFAAVQAASTIKYLREFGISLDKIKHLTPNVSNINKLQKLTLIDNLSWITEKHLSQLSASNFNLEQSINQGEKTRYYAITYLASNDEITDYDRNHLISLFTDSKIVPFLNEFSDSGAYAQFAKFVPLTTLKQAQFEPIFKYKHIVKNDMETEYVFEGSNQQDRIYFIQNNAAVFIPKNSLQSQFDSNYIGNYQLRISFNNSPSQFFKSSNTLQFDSAGLRYTLAPSAMFEIQAQSGLKILSIKPGYFIKVVFMGKIDSADAFYAFNASKNKWENWWDYDYEFDDLKNVKIDFYQFYGGKKTAKLVSDINALPPALHFETSGYYYHCPPNLPHLTLSKQGNYFLPATNTKTTNQLRLNKGKKYVQFSRFTKYQKQDVIALKITDKTGVLFPEIKRFAKIPLFIQTSMSPRDFNNQFISKKRYYDVQLENNGNQLYLNLKLDDGYWQFALTQPYQLEKPRVRQGKFFKAFKKYELEHTNRLKAWQEAMLNQETTFANEAIKNLLNNTTQTSEFKIRSMGAFTWAHPVINDDTFNLIIKPSTQGGVPIVAKRFIVAQRVPFTYQSFDAQKTYSVAINIKNLQYLVCIDNKDQIYILNGKEFGAMGIKNNTYIELPMQELPQPIDNTALLKKILDIKK